MSKRISIVPLLLVVMLGQYTHAWSIPHLRSGATPNEITTDGKSNETRNEVRKFISVVQDWNLVCKQLCGAGLGGPSCGPQCDEIKQKQYALTNPDTILDPNRKAICETLCKLNLGGSTCQCSDERNENSIQQDAVCDSFCVENKITISGCSICPGQTPNVKTVNSSVAISAALAAPNASAGEAADTTTPDWNELCVSLCKIGEGGALCNCDLPPFF